MKFSRLTVICAAAALTIAACKKTDYTTYSNDNIPINREQVVDTATFTTNASATASADYARVSRDFEYTIQWNTSGDLNTTTLSRSGLDTITAIRIHGPADKTGNGAAIQTLTSGVTNLQFEGSYSGTLYIDGKVVKEEDLLNGKYYFVIYSKARPHTNPKTQAGLIRGQIVLNKD